jgi:hypothetical protein
MSADDFKRTRIPISRVTEHFGKGFRGRGYEGHLLTNYAIVRSRLDVRYGDGQRPSKNVEIVPESHCKEMR